MYIFMMFRLLRCCCCKSLLFSFILVMVSGW